MLKVLGLIFLVYYIIWPLLKLVFKGYVITQVHRRQSEFDIRNQQKAAQRKEGVIDVDYVPPKNKAKSDQVGGDYVPYEEVNE
ncbi:hypothetical protein [Aquirufa sp.]|jgi:hypothetical protein|uniref:hypothetical protein n=1 Tax=Aquirufa sp. TaxID=2676249 RepID=UPI0037BEBF22